VISERCTASRHGPSTLWTTIEHFAGEDRIAHQGPRRGRARDEGDEGDPRIAAYEAQYRAQREDIEAKRAEMRAHGRTFLTSMAQLLAILAALLVAFSLVVFLLAKVVGTGVLKFSVPALIAFVAMGYREHRKQRKG